MEWITLDDKEGTTSVTRVPGGLLFRYTFRDQVALEFVPCDVEAAVLFIKKGEVRS